MTTSDTKSGPPSNPGWPRGQEEIAIDARGGAHGTRYRSPDQALRIGLPREPRRRQGLGAGVVVVLELGPEREPQVFVERDLVLSKHVCPAQAAIGGQESQNGAVGDAVVPVTVAAAPSQPVRSDRPQTVLEFNIENVQVLSERSRDIALGVVEIGLNLQLSPSGEIAVPAAEQVVSGDVGILVNY